VLILKYGDASGTSPIRDITFFSVLVGSSVVKHRGKKNFNPAEQREK
jgi:hypothetical protein